MKNMSEQAKIIINERLNKLSESKFRQSFKLRKYMIKYIDEKGMNIILSHAKDFVKKNLGSAYPVNDGKQTPTKNHPVFIAQHATATCCRGCLEKWHNIKKGKELTKNEQNYIVAIIIEWIKRNYKKGEYNE